MRWGRNAVENFKFFSIWCALICALLCVTPAHAEQSCATIFGSALQNTSNDGHIDIRWNGQVLNDPDNQLETKQTIDFDPAGLATCGSVDCTASGSAVAASAPTFQTFSGSKADVTIPYNEGMVTYTLSSQAYSRLQSNGNGTTIRDDGGYTTYYFDQLTLAYRDKLILQGGARLLDQLPFPGNGGENHYLWQRNCAPFYQLRCRFSLGDSHQQSGGCGKFVDCSLR